jgi:hypothetical protein
MARSSSSANAAKKAAASGVRMPLEVYETPELERAVAWTDDYVIVDKIPAAEPFVEDDPRGSPSS